MLFLGLALLALPFVLPIVSLVKAARTRAALRDLEQQVAEQGRLISGLSRQLKEMRSGVTDAAKPPAAPPAAAPIAPRPVAPSPMAPPGVIAPREARPIVAPPVVSPPIVPAPVTTPPILPTKPPTVAAEETPSYAFPAFDWENLVGVKLFSGIAAIALVLAGIFFLRYSAERGWLEPPVRAAIGLLTAIALLVACELKAARRYSTTANAMDAAAIAILFSTFFSAHALWHLIPASVAFVMLALVTAVAVLLSIRRDSLFIAMLGLIGGFATPVLLSTGENQPIPLFAYLLLLNIGLAWVAHRKRWTALSVLTVALTALYQWGWVFRFLSESQLPLAAGIFMLFAVVSMAALVLRPQVDDERADSSSDRVFERTGLAASALPLLFSAYMAAVPAYGQHTGVLFGMLLLVDVGLLAVALARREERLHAGGALGTLLIFVLWLSQSYAFENYTTILWLLPVFVSFYAFAPAIAERVDQPFLRDARRTIYAAPLLLLALPVFAAAPQTGTSPLPLFAVLFALVALLAWRAIALGNGPLYFIAAFFAVAAQAVWSTHFLSPSRLPAAMLIYGLFGLLSMSVPLIVRRRHQLLAPPWGSGVLLLSSLGLLLFMATGPVSMSAFWGLAVLVAILDACMFVESAAGALPLVSAAGGVMSWLILWIWWSRSAAALGLLPSLLFVLLMTLIMLAGYAWSYFQVTAGASPNARDGVVAGFRNGLFLALGGHLFLVFIAADPASALPPWPLFGAIAVMTLAVSITSVYARVHALHAGGTAGAMLAILFWASAAPAAPWTWVAIIAAACIAGFALAWMRVTERLDDSPIPAIGAGITLFLFEAVLLNVGSLPGAPRVEVFIAAHVTGITAILALAWRAKWRHVAPAAVVPAALAMAGWHTQHPEPDAWMPLLSLSAAIYAVFVAYPFVLGRRVQNSRDPHLAAVLASGAFLLAARQALVQGGFGWTVGAVPVVEGVILALMLRQLLRIQEDSHTSDVGRLALVAGASLACATVAIPLQLHQQWITIGWALEGAALAWLFLRIPHRGLLYAASGLLAAVFVRLALNPAIFHYEPRGSLRVFNWYLYTYVTCAAAFFLASWFLSRSDDRIGGTGRRLSQFVPAAAVVLLFIVLNIEIADFYATGPEIMFRFGATLAQDLTYTIGWLAFGMVLLTAAIYFKTYAGRIAALALIAVTTFKCFLYDLGSLGGLYRIGSFVGLAFALTLVSLALQRFVLRAPKAS